MARKHRSEKSENEHALLREAHRRFDVGADLRIDPMALDQACLEQSTITLRYTEAAARARSEMDRAKDQLDVEHASLYLLIKEDPKSYGLDGKPTGDTIEAAIRINRAYRRRMQAYLDARHDYEVLSAAVKAVDHKLTALNGLIRLGAMNYFVMPNEPLDLSRGGNMERKRKAAVDAVMEARRRKRAVTDEDDEDEGADDD